MSNLGIVTIGQAPRSDVVPQMRRYLPAGTRIIEAGALDGLSTEQAAEFRPRSGEYILTTRMTTGESVVVSKERLMPRLQGAFQQVLKAGADIALILCTGELPELSGQALVVRPDRILRHIVLGFRPRRLGILIPLPEQIGLARERWSEVVPELAVACADPYGDPTYIPQAGLELLDRDPELIVMDCMGYREGHRREVKAATGVPTVLANAAVSRLLAEVL